MHNMNSIFFSEALKLKRDNGYETDVSVTEYSHFAVHQSHLKLF